MPFKRRILRKRPVGLRKVGRRRLYSKKPAVAVRNYVQRAISRNTETKFHSTTYTYTSFNGGISAVGDVIDILPSIGLGTGQSSRVGHKIQPIRLEITGYVAYTTDAYNDARMLGGRLFVYQDKTVRSYANSSIVNYNLLNLGGTSTNFTGTAMNYITPHNNDLFRFFMDKKMIFMKPFGVTNNVGVPSATTSMTSMDKSLFHPFKLVLTKKHLPAVLSYDTTDNANYPTNFAPKMSLGYCDLLNYNPDTVPVQLGMEFCATLYYKDA